MVLREIMPEARPRSCGNGGTGAQSAPSPAVWNGAVRLAVPGRVGCEAGLRLTYDKSSISYWLSGTTPRAEVQEVVRETLSRRLRRPVTPEETGFGSDGPGAGFALVVRFVARNAAAARAFDQLAAAAIEGIRAEEPGTLLYINHTVPDEPNVRLFYELYADRSAFEEHERQPHVRRFLAERRQYLESFEVTFLDTMSGKGP
ncbi:putative quinol monooxygenase [Kitasatospora sp. NPDC058444]|uniref:putative quinol monooxygenase n=1 Tax=Kitasatospora sp. NPDC058444 TaxID=3346504 RepID=UPI003663C16B